MNTKSILLETIIAGFLCLLVIVLFIALQMSNEDIKEVFAALSSISGGASALLVILAFVISYIFGSLSHRIGADLSTLYQKIKGTNEPNLYIDKSIDERLARDYSRKWVVKSFYRSIMLLFPFILIESLMLDDKLSFGEYFWIIFLMGSLIEVITIIAFITQRKDYLESHNQLKELLGK